MNLVSALNFNRFLPNNLDGTQARTESSFSEQRDRSHLTLALNNFKARPLAQNDITSPSSLEGIPLICRNHDFYYFYNIFLQVYIILILLCI